MVVTATLCWLGSAERLCCRAQGINAVGTSSTKAMAVDLATAQGMGKGEFMSFFVRPPCLSVGLVTVELG